MTNRPWVNDRIYAPYKLSALVETLAEMGVPGNEALCSTGLTPGQLDDPETKTSIAQYLAACRQAVRLTGNPALPFLVGRKMHLSAYGMYGYALMCCVSLRDFFNEGVKYHRLATPLLVMEWVEENGMAIWRFPGLSSPELSADLHMFLIEQQLVQNMVHLKDVGGPGCSPLEAVLPYPRPEHASLYSTHLGCPVTFERDVCELRYDASILDQPAQLAHKLTSTLMQATCDRLIGQAKTSHGVSGQVYQILMTNPGEMPTMEAVAAMVYMNERTLRRKLEAEDTSYVEIVDDVRASLAKEYLQTTQMSTEDIASLVGFSDAANFRRAFKRWTGRTPSEFRV